MKCLLRFLNGKEPDRASTEETKPDAMATLLGDKEASTIFDAGWRQCRVFKPCESVQHDEDCYFVICTQSCSVVSRNWERDPFVEIIVGRPVESYNENSDEARGRIVAKFALPVEGADFKALELDINSRSFKKRELLLQITPESFTVSEEARRNFAGWIGRYYSRIALPNALVERMKPKILKTLKKFVSATHQSTRKRRSDLIHSIWIKFEPYDELPIEADYIVEIKILCEDPAHVEEFERDLNQKFGTPNISGDGISFACEVGAVDQTFYGDLRGWIKFSEWDYLSGMGDAADIPEA